MRIIRSILLCIIIISFHIPSLKSQFVSQIDASGGLSKYTDLYPPGEFSQSNYESPVRSQSSKKNWEEILLSPLKYGFVHFYFAGQLWIFKCREFGELIDPVGYYPVDIIYNLGFAFGFRNILQIDYKFINTGGNNLYIENPTFSNIFNKDELPMKWKNNEWIFKVNPFFTKLNEIMAVYLYYGFGNKITYADSEDILLELNGKNNVFGIEVSWIKRVGSIGFFVDYRRITFSTLELSTVGKSEIKYKAGIVSFGARFSVGLGY